MVRFTTMATLDLMLNGAPLHVDVRDGETLLETLRTRCGVTSIKDGCQPQGQCGCCLVLVDGNAKVSSAMPAEAARGRSIVTLEGIAAEEQRMLARSFVAGDANGGERSHRVVRTKLGISRAVESNGKCFSLFPSPFPISSPSKQRAQTLTGMTRVTHYC